MPVRLRTLDLPTLDTTQVDDYALFVASDERPLWGLGGLIDWRLAGALSAHLREGMVSGEPGESFLTTVGTTLPGKRIFTFGLGPLAQIRPEVFSIAAARAVTTLQRAQAASLAIGLPEQPSLAKSARALVNALKPLEGIDVSLFGPMPELGVVLPELVARK